MLDARTWYLKTGLDDWCSALMLDPNCVIAEYVKRFTYGFYVWCATLIVQAGGMPWLQQAHLYSMARINDLYGYLDKHKVRGLVPLLWSIWLSSSSPATPHKLTCLNIKEAYFTNPSQNIIILDFWLIDSRTKYLLNRCSCIIFNNSKKTFRNTFLEFLLERLN